MPECRDEALAPAGCVAGPRAGLEVRTPLSKPTVPAAVASIRTTRGTAFAGALCIRRSDGTQTSKPVFASERAARDARRRLIEQVERGEVRHTKETFGAYWDRWLAQRRPYLEAGTWTGYATSGRKRLVPALGHLSLGELTVERVRDFVADLAEAVEAGDLAVKTVNTTLVTLVVCLNHAVDDGLIPANPALRVRRLPAAHIERGYLRLDEIPRYLDACSELYRPLAELLIGSGLRISEALGLRIGDLDLENTGGTIVVYRSRKRIWSAPALLVAADYPPSTYSFG